MSEQILRMRQIYELRLRRAERERAQAYREETEASARARRASLARQAEDQRRSEAELSLSRHPTDPQAQIWLNVTRSRLERADRAAEDASIQLQGVRARRETARHRHNAGSQRLDIVDDVERTIQRYRSLCEELRSEDEAGGHRS